MSSLTHTFISCLLSSPTLHTISLVFLNQPVYSRSTRTPGSSAAMKLFTQSFLYE